MIDFYLKLPPPNEEIMCKLRKNGDAPTLLGDLATRMEDITDWVQAKESIAFTAEAHGIKPGKLMFPLRVALSQRSGGPDLDEMLAILGKEECIRRLKILNKQLAGSTESQ